MYKKNTAISNLVMGRMIDSTTGDLITVTTGITITAITDGTSATVTGATVSYDSTTGTMNIASIPAATMNGDEVGISLNLATAIGGGITRVIRTVEFTNDELNTAIGNVPTNSELTTALADLPTNSELTTALGDLPTNSELTTALSDLPTNSELTTALADLPTNSELSTALDPIATTTEVNDARDSVITTGNANWTTGTGGGGGSNVIRGLTGTLRLEPKVFSNGNIGVATMAECGYKEIDICLVRGDTEGFKLFIVDENNEPVNITGATVKLAVSTSSAPADTNDQLFDLVGTITSGPRGEVDFDLNRAKATQVPDTYFYDIQVILSDGTVKTLIKGKWTVEADITDAGVTS